MKKVRKRCYGCKRLTATAYATPPPGKDNEVRVAKVRSSKSHLERAVQQLFPLELSCDPKPPTPPVVMNPQASVFQPRRDAAVAAQERLKELIQDEEN